MRVPGPDLHGRVPDVCTIRLFRELLTRAKAIDVPFSRFEAHLRDRGCLATGGQMIDASIVAAPRQRNTDAQKDDLKAGRIPEDRAANPAKLRQKHRDGRWTPKPGRRKRKPDGTPVLEIATPACGDKSHVGVDRRHRFVRTWSVTDAARHDGPVLPGLLDRSNTGSSVRADTAYRSAKNARRIAGAGLVSKVRSRKPPGKPMPAPNQRATAARSRDRSGVEHVFADRKHRMGLFVRTGGIEGAHQDRPRQHRLPHASASVPGDSNGRSSIAQRARPAILGRKTPPQERQTQPPAAGNPLKANPERRTMDVSA